MGDYKIKADPVFGSQSTFESNDYLMDYLDEIGPHLSRVIIEFNALEDEISFYICKLFNTEDTEKVYAFIGDLMFKKKATKLLQLYHIECRRKHVAFAEVLTDLNKQFESAAKNRNDVTHGSWLHSSSGGDIPVSIKSNNKGLTMPTKKFNIESLKTMLNEITTARAHLTHFHNRLMKSSCQGFKLNQNS